MSGRLVRNRVLRGDAVARMAELPGESVDCVITSPPYFGLRNYGHPEQLGLEPTVEAWVGSLRVVAQQVARLLKPGGSFWLNVGDGYSNHSREGAAKKSLLLGPQRLAVALADDGWIVRNQVVWAKTNPMPSSVSDRLSCTYEVLLFLTRTPRYYFDLDAIRVPATSQPPRAKRAAGGPVPYPPPDAAPLGPVGSGMSLNTGLSRLKQDGRGSHPLGKNPGDGWRRPASGRRTSRPSRPGWCSSRCWRPAPSGYVLPAASPGGGHRLTGGRYRQPADRFKLPAAAAGPARRASCSIPLWAAGRWP